MAFEPGEYFLSPDPVEINAGRPTVEVNVSNTGDRSIQVGSHFHFFEVNRALVFDREAAFGMRLGIPAGTAVRFEPGDTKEVVLVAIGGTRRVTGLNGLTNGNVDVAAVKTRAMRRAAQEGFGGTQQGEVSDAGD